MIDRLGTRSASPQMGRIAEARRLRTLFTKGDDPAMQCPKCQATLKEDAVYCHQCGRRLTATTGGTKVRRIASERRSTPPSLTMPITPPQGVPITPFSPPSRELDAIIAAETREWTMPTTASPQKTGPDIAHTGMLLADGYRITALLGFADGAPIYEIESGKEDVCWSCGIAYAPDDAERFCDECGAERRPRTFYVRQVSSGETLTGEIFGEGGMRYVILAHLPESLQAVLAEETQPDLEYIPTAYTPAAALDEEIAIDMATTVTLDFIQGSVKALPPETELKNSDETVTELIQANMLEREEPVVDESITMEVPTLEEDPEIVTPLAPNESTEDVWEQNNTPTVETRIMDFMPATGKLSHTVQLYVGIASDVGRSRYGKPNEDTGMATTLTFVGDNIPQPLTLCLVADGLGGHDDGQRAGRMAARFIAERVTQQLWLPSLSQQFPPVYDSSVLENALRNAIIAANAEMVSINRSEGNDMGCTITAFIAQGDIACIANVGDSRTYHFDGERLRRATIDHSLVARMVSAGLLTAEEIYTHPQRSQIYRSLGDEEDIEVDLFRYQLRPGDYFILCSDGLWEMVRDPDIAQILGQNYRHSPQDLAEQLVATANAHGGEDNVTVIVVEVENA
jgi:serine/threonine protein phosphatase PrpC